MNKGNDTTLQIIKERIEHNSKHISQMRCRLEDAYLTNNLIDSSVSMKGTLALIEANNKVLKEALAIVIK